MNIRLFGLSLILILIFYFVPRLGWLNTIEFGYDQPQLAIIIYEFIANGDYFSSQEYSQLTPWNYLSWGPALTMGYVPFFIFSSDVTVISSLFTLFNALSIVIVVYLGWHYFGPVAGISAGIILAAHPWWVIFSRMIYSPSPTGTLAALIMMFTFLFIEKPRSIALSLLMFLWGMAIQFYLNTFSVILPSFVVVIASIRKHFSFKFSLLGSLLVLLLFVPSYIYYTQNPDLFYGFFSVDKTWETKATPAIERLQFSVSNYLSILAGGSFHYQLGSAESAFDEQMISQIIPQSLLLIITAVVLMYSGLILFKAEVAHRLQRLLLFAWVLGPAWFLFLVKTPHIVPRYYLVCLPAFALLFGIFLRDMLNLLTDQLSKFRYVLIIIPLLMAAWWTYFIISYYDFILAYDYPTGFISHTSDTPYSFLVSAFDWIQADASKQDFDSIVVSSNLENPKQPALIHAAEYYWKYVWKKDLKIQTSDRTGYYMLHFSPRTDETPANARQFGPYIVYRNENVDSE